jgi:malonate decarboxylase delta subunit
MENLTYEYGPWGNNLKKIIKNPIIVGVVGSGNLEVLFESKDLDGKTLVYIETSVDGFSNTWSAVMKDFTDQFQFSNTLITINDGGATPAVVQLRLSQAAHLWSEK